mmetsp:Transcript_99313/g.281248  ORF Transcript_99313/g.281248 Transcript_99313/m.281248 type:complete len:215 (-) Transcript_99313:340-984(-)
MNREHGLAVHLGITAKRKHCISRRTAQHQALVQSARLAPAPRMARGAEDRHAPRIIDGHLDAAARGGAAAAARRREARHHQCALAALWHHQLRAKVEALVLAPLGAAHQGVRRSGADERRACVVARAGPEGGTLAPRGLRRLPQGGGWWSGLGRSPGPPLRRVVAQPPLLHGGRGVRSSVRCRRRPHRARAAEPVHGDEIHGHADEQRHGDKSK